MISEEKIKILDRYIRKRWDGQFGSDSFIYVASQYLEKVPFQGKRVLDMGCGSGLLLFTACLLSEPARAVGLDAYEGEGSPVSDYDFALEAKDALGLPFVEVVKGNALKLPFKKGEFDIVFASHFFHHIYESRNRPSRDSEENIRDIKRVLKNIYNVLSPGGVLIISEEPRYTGMRLLQPLGLIPFTDYSTKQEPKEWIKLLRTTGFENFKVLYHTPYNLRKMKMIFSNSLGRYLISGQYYIFASRK